MSDEAADFTVDRVLDVKGLSCPLPILKTKVALTKMQPGEILHVLATDPLAPIDFKAFCLRTEHALLHSIEQEENERFEFFIRRA